MAVLRRTQTCKANSRGHFDMAIDSRIPLGVNPFTPGSALLEGRAHGRAVEADALNKRIAEAMLSMNQAKGVREQEAHDLVKLSAEQNRIIRNIGPRAHAYRELLDTNPNALLQRVKQDRSELVNRIANGESVTTEQSDELIEALEGGIQTGNFGLAASMLDETINVARQFGVDLPEVRQPTSLEEQVGLIKRIHPEGEDRNNAIMRLLGADGEIRSHDPTHSLVDTATGEVLVAGAEGAPDNFKDTLALRKDFLKQSGNFIALDEEHRRMESLAGTPAGDLALVITYMKALDPNSVVREGEQVQVRQTASIPARAWQTWLKVSGEGSLTDTVRNDIKGRIDGLYNAQIDLQRQREREYTNLANDFRIKPGLVLGESFVREIPDRDAATLSETEKENKSVAQTALDAWRNSQK